MTSQPTPSGALPASSQWSPEGSQASNASSDATTGRTTPPRPTECSKTDIQADIKTIAAYLVEERAPAIVQAALGRIDDAYRRRVEQRTTEQAISQLQAAVQELSNRVENKPYGPARLGSYAAVAGQGLPAQARTQQSLNTGHVTLPTLQKPVPLRHKREIIVVRGTETADQKRRTYKELLEQLNSTRVAGEAVAIRKLGSGDMILTMEDEQARTSWLTNSQWLETLGEGARVKRREFAVMAHGIKVNQIQGQAQAIEEIYRQNPKLRGAVNIVRVTFTKKLLRSGRTTGPLIISVTEPEQANRLIDAGLIWQYELHDCEPFDGDCVITQCFKCYQYGHTGQRCRNTQRCGFCAAPGHATNDCIGKEDCTKHLCVSCQGNHTSWARECLVRAKHAEAAKLAYINRPARYQVNLSSVRKLGNPQQTPQASQASQAQPEEPQRTPQASQAS
jgi:hypothetical protein